MQGLPTLHQKKPKTTSRATTILDIARETGLVPSSVSRILNNQSNFSANPKTRKKVMDLARELNYRPKRAARALVTGRSYTITIVLGEIEHDFTYPPTAVTLTAMIQTLWQRGYSTNFLPVAKTVSMDEAVLQTLRESHADGYYLPRGLLLPNTLQELRDRGVPVASLQMSRTSRVPDMVSYVEMDEAQAATELIQGLVRLGHRSFACFGSSRFRLIRFDAFQTALEQVAPEATLDSILYQPAGTGGVSHERWDAYIEMKRRLSDIRKATAILCTSDLVAWGVMAALREAGLEPGRDITVTGQDNLEGNPAAYPAPQDAGLTTIDPNPVGRGQAIAELLLDRIQSPDHEPAIRLIPMQVLFRKTHGPAPARA